MNKNTIKEEIELQANNLSNTDSFLQLLKDLKDCKPNILLHKSLKYNNKDFTISWNKTIHKDTIAVLFNSIRHEDKKGDMLDGLATNNYVNTMTMMKTLKPLEIQILHKKNNKKLVFNILNTSEEKKTKINLIFKILFFYSYSYLNKELKKADEK